MSETSHNDKQIPTYDKLLGETARVSWAEIERMFALGRVIEVAAALDLIKVAEAFAEDDKDRVRGWMQAQKLGHLADDNAARWASDTTLDLWAVVVNPWVLVQERAAE